MQSHGLRGGLSAALKLALWEPVKEQPEAALTPVALLLSLQWTRSPLPISFGLEIKTRWAVLLAACALWAFSSSTVRRLLRGTVSSLIRRLRNPPADESPRSPMDYAASRTLNRGKKHHYRQLDLSKAEIRAVCILPGSGGDEIYTNIVHVSLLNKPKYIALSYAWGSSSRKRQIVVDGYDFEVGTNLGDFLSQARRDRGPHRGALYWIDALCINQADEDERNEQVRMMRRIYESATNVTIWLGLPSPKTELAFAAMRALESMVYDWSNLHAVDYKTIVLPRSDEEWKAIAGLLSSPYFRRLWIAQEITSPLRHNVEVVGGREMQRFSLHSTLYVAESFMSSVRGVERLGGPNNGSSPFVAACSAFQSIYRINDLQNARYRLRPGSRYHILHYLRGLFSSTMKTSHLLLWRYEILPLLQEQRLANASDPRDKVFSTLSILRPYVDEGMIDYRLTTQKVYIGIAQAAIANTGDLEILSYCGKRAGDLPSWVPDWQVPSGMWPLRILHDVERKCIYASSDDANPIVTFQDCQMTVRGVIVDSIRLCSEHCGESGGDDPADWRLLADQTTADDSIDTLNRTLVGDSSRYFLGLENSLTWPGYLAALSFRFVDFISNVNLSMQARTEYEGQLMRIGRDQSRGRVRLVCQRDFNQRATNNLCVSRVILPGRRLCLTAAKRLGVVPSHARNDDIVAVLLGGHTPFILRRRHKTHELVEEARYELVGECYIDGLMDGQALAAVKAGDLSLEDLVLI